MASYCTLNIFNNCKSFVLIVIPPLSSTPRKSALLHSGPGSGRIVYEPDANDDFDQEDPDDDLDV